jgi:putative peptide zinc metalloprotease protein
MKSDQGKSKNIWEDLNKNLDNPFSGDLQNGIWGQVSPQPGGVWKEARDETVLVSRNKENQPGIWKDSMDETLLIQRGQQENVWDQVGTHIEDTPMQEEKIGIWDEIEDETLMVARTKDVLWQSPKIRDIGKIKPMRAVGWALKQLETAKGETYWVLKNLRKDVYLRLTEQQVYLWNSMDGSHTVQDLAVCMFLEYKTLSIDSLMSFVEQLRVNGFLVSEKVDVYKSVGQRLSRYSLKYWLKRIGQFLLQSEFSIKGIDKFYGTVYKLGGRLLFTPPTLLLITLATIAGIPAFIYVTLQGEYSFLQGSSDSFGMGVIGILLTQTIAIFTHESAHALTTKHYGRTVKRGGAGLYMGLLTFFMDTTDIWMEPRKPRLAVTWAGPFSGFILGSLASLILMVVSTSTWAGIAYQFATLCYGMSAINLNPLLKLDGYYLLMDWLEMPMLRERSFNFIRQKLWPKLAKREKFSSEERVFTIFGILSAAWTVFFVGLIVQLYGAKIFNFFLSMF